MKKTRPKRILIVDDQIDELNWLLDVFLSAGYEVVLVSDEETAIQELDEIAAHRAQYDLAVVDVMVAAKSVEALVEEISRKDLASGSGRRSKQSRDAGIRICEYARSILGLKEVDLPIQCLTVRTDAAVIETMRRLGIPVSERLPEGSTGAVLESIARLLQLKLRPHSSSA